VRAFYARNKVSQRNDTQFGANDCAYGGVLGVSFCRNYLGSNPALAVIRSQVRQLGDLHRDLPIGRSTILLLKG
jgi:hypothetical protein